MLLRYFLISWLLCACGLGSKKNLAISSDRVGNGGSVVVNGETYQLADLYFKPYEGNSFTFDERLGAELSVFNSSLSKWGINSFDLFEKQITSELVQYYFVGTLPQDCNDPTDVIGGTPSVQFACTKGYVTWINPKYFAPLPIEQKAAAIIHERLHAFAISQPHEVIAPFVRGSLLLREIARNPDRHLSATELETLRGLNFSGRQLGIVDNSTKGIHPYGGGRIVEFQWAGLPTGPSIVAADAFVSFDSRVINSTIASGARLVSSTVMKSEIGRSTSLTRASVIPRVVRDHRELQDFSVSTRIGEGCHIERSVVAGVELGKQVSVEDSSVIRIGLLNQPETFRIDEGVVIAKSELTSLLKGSIGKDSIIEGTTLGPIVSEHYLNLSTLVLGDGVELKNSNLTGGLVTVGSNSRIDHLETTLASFILGRGSQINNFAAAQVLGGFEVKFGENSRIMDSKFSAIYSAGDSVCFDFADQSRIENSQFEVKIPHVAGTCSGQMLVRLVNAQCVFHLAPSSVLRTLHSDCSVD